MPKSDQTKKTEAAYKKAHLMGLSTTVSKEKGEAFRRYCAAHGVSVHTALKNFVEACMIAEEK